MEETLGQYLKRVRKEGILTLRAVEEKTGVSNAYLSQVESDRIAKPSPSILNKLAKCYGISYEYLMKLAGYPLPENLDEGKPSFRIGSGFNELTDEEKKRVLEYIEFLRSRRR